MHPSAQTQDLDRESLLDLTAAQQAAERANCYRMYVLYYEQSANYPLDCDALLPMPYPPASPTKLRSSRAGAPPGPPDGGMAAADAATRRLQQAVLSGAEPASSIKPLPAAADTVAAPAAENGACHGLACDSANQAAAMSMRKVESSSELFEDALCYAQSALRLLPGDVEQWITDTSTAVRMLAAVRAPAPVAQLTAPEQPSSRGARSTLRPTS